MNYLMTSHYKSPTLLILWLLRLRLGFDFLKMLLRVVGDLILFLVLLVARTLFLVDLKAIDLRYI
jgi:hypothetical protein